jgi:hypothetical protein
MKKKKNCGPFFVRICFAKRLAGGVSFALPNNPPSYLRKRVGDSTRSRVIAVSTHLEQIL